jgi:hypothetical protein
MFGPESTNSANSATAPAHSEGGLGQWAHATGLQSIQVRFQFEGRVSTKPLPTNKNYIVGDVACESIDEAWEQLGRAMVAAMRGGGHTVSVRVPDTTIEVDPADIPDSVVHAMARSWRGDATDDSDVESPPSSPPSPPSIKIRRSDVEVDQRIHDKRRRICASNEFCARTIIKNLQARAAAAGTREEVESISDGSSA